MTVRAALLFVIGVWLGFLGGLACAAWLAERHRRWLWHEAGLDRRTPILDLFEGNQGVGGKRR